MVSYLLWMMSRTDLPDATSSLSCTGSLLTVSTSIPCVFTPRHNNALVYAPYYSFNFTLRRYTASVATSLNLTLEWVNANTYVEYTNIFNFSAAPTVNAAWGWLMSENVGTYATRFPMVLYLGSVSAAYGLHSTLGPAVTPHLYIATTTADSTSLLTCAFNYVWVFRSLACQIQARRAGVNIYALASDFATARANDTRFDSVFFFAAAFFIFTS